MSTPITWQKSSYSSGGEPENCIEIGGFPSATHLRESETPHTTLPLTPHRLAGLIRTLQAGTLDRPGNG
ncbi:DUF397 domain-containing protein [Streptomyces sp. ISL-11]|uniref:DUF397 domain-containing protein n=1 Tax=Streptomyces sp. ISL-11 TaxID=2819174 RepID=UPI001BEAFD1C|nr:DUF397 domain-containing protein [Streptomyces sp. ISL-11]MBT2384838.1 DUF397 domain-containing protein [Streptomyces sp. ISL-11]